VRFGKLQIDIDEFCPDFTNQSDTAGTGSIERHPFCSAHASSEEIVLRNVFKSIWRADIIFYEVHFKKYAFAGSNYLI
jgi:hypothetical protein